MLVFFFRGEYLAKKKMQQKKENPGNKKGTFLIVLAEIDYFLAKYSLFCRISINFLSPRNNILKKATFLPFLEIEKAKHTLFDIILYRV